MITQSFTSATHQLPRSLEDVHGTIDIPAGGHWYRRLIAFAGPAYMVSVGYMDPGNWATDLAGGAKFGYALIWVLLMSNLMAILLQTLSARLGLASGRDLAQACRDAYSPPVRWTLFLLCEIAIAACDLAEVLGTAIGLNLLTKSLGMFGGEGLPLMWAVLITGFDVFLLLAIQRFGIRKMEAFIITLVAMIGACFIIELFLSKPDPRGIARGFVPGTEIFRNHEMLYIAIGILGATVMPHNLYLHSALVQSRKVGRSSSQIRQAAKFNLVDSTIALNCAFFVNAAILVVSAAVFWRNGRTEVNDIGQAHQLLDHLLGTKVAPFAFAIALICAGQSSTITGTLAGQITMEGFLHFRMRPWLRRLITRSLAIIPAIITIAISGEGGTTKLLILSQVILSLQLPFAVVPLVKFTSTRSKMGPLATPPLLAGVAWLVAAIIVGLNGKLAYDAISDWSSSAGRYRALVLTASISITAALAVLLLWMTFRREGAERGAAAVSAEAIATAAGLVSRDIRTVGVALEATSRDVPMLAEAIAVARIHRARLLLMHVVEGVGGQYHGSAAGDVEFRQDDEYLRDLVIRLRRDLDGTVPGVEYVLGFGDVRRGIIDLSRKYDVNLLVLGGHGHRGVSDILRGTTIDGVRHGLKIPVIAVRDMPG